MRINSAVQPPDSHGPRRGERAERAERERAERRAERERSKEEREARIRSQENENGVFDLTRSKIRRLSSRRQSKLEELRERRKERETNMQERENERINDIEKRMEDMAGRVGPRVLDLQRKMREAHQDEELTEAEREAKIRQYENEMVDAVKEDDNARHKMIEMMANQIVRIQEQRAKREELLAQSEARSRQLKLEARMRDREEAAETAAQRNSQPKDEDEVEQANNRQEMRHLARFGVNREAVGKLSVLRATRRVEAAILGAAIENSAVKHTQVHEPTLTQEQYDMMNILSDVIGWGRGEKSLGARDLIFSTMAPTTTTIVVPASVAEPNDFRNTEMRKLIDGLQRIDMAIAGRVADMYRTSMEMAKEMKTQNDEVEEDEEASEADGEMAGEPSGVSITTTQAAPQVSAPNVPEMREGS